MVFLYIAAVTDWATESSDEWKLKTVHTLYLGLVSLSMFKPKNVVGGSVTSFKLNEIF